MAPSSMYTAPIDKGIHMSEYTASDSLVWPGARAQKFHLGPSVKDRHLETVRKALKRRDTHALQQQTFFCTQLQEAGSV